MINKIQPLLDNTPKVVGNKARYVQNRVSPYQGSGFVPLQSITITNFEITELVWNPSKTVLEFTISIPAQGGVLVPFIPSDFASFFSRIQLKTSEGLILVNITDVDRYTKASMPFMNDPYENTQTEGYICPSWRTTLDSTLNPNGEGCDSYYDVTNAFTGSFVVSADALTTYLRNNSPITYNNHFEQADVIYTKTFTIPLGKLLPESFFVLDKDIYVHPMNLEIHWKSWKYWGFNVTLPNAPAIPAIAPTSVTNLTLLYYSLTDEEVCQILRAAPMELMMPYVYTYYQSYASTGTQTTNFKILSPSNHPDNRCLKLYYLVNMPDLTGNVASCLCNSSNVPSNITDTTVDILQNPKLFNYFQNTVGGKLTLNLNTFIDIMGHVLSTHEHCFEGARDYMVNSCVVTSFTTELCGKYLLDGETIIGLPMNGNYMDVSTNITTSALFNSNAATAPSLNHHMFAVILTRIFCDNGVIHY